MSGGSILRQVYQAMLKRKRDQQKEYSSIKRLTSDGFKESILDRDDEVSVTDVDPDRDTEYVDTEDSGGDEDLNRYHSSNSRLDINLEPSLSLDVCLFPSRKKTLMQWPMQSTNGSKPGE